LPPDGTPDLRITRPRKSIDSQLVLAANENFVTSFAKLAEHCDGGEHRWFRGVFAYVTGLPLSLFNGCVVLGSVTATVLDDALAWVARHDVPKRLFVVQELESHAAPIAAEHGLARDFVSPGMILRPIPEPPATPRDVVVSAVDATGIEEFRQVGIKLGLGRELAETMFSTSFFGDPDVQAFVGRLDGRPVGYSLAIRSEGAGGVYNVGTLPEARRRGLGTAVTWAAVDVARRAGFDCAVLQSSEMAIPMYEAMGFRTVVRYAVFREPVTPTGQETPVPPSPQ
jgi:ribosomal protein S18 acetylase RimI-like enzyme